MTIVSLPTEPARPAARAGDRAPRQGASALSCSALPARRARRAALLVAALLCPACKGAGASAGLAKGERADDGPLQVPTPPENGPKLVALRAGAPILERPQPGARKLGELAPGALVARSAEPYGRSGCADGWYAVRPRGFVCAGDAATLRTEVLPLLPAPPDRARPLPYRYGRARTQGTPAYRWVPSREELAQAEPDLDRHRDRAERMDAVLGASANDVPLDARGVAAGPPVLLPTGDGVDERARRTEASYFVFPAGDATAPLVPLAALAAGRSAAAAPSAELKPIALRKGSGVAITRAMVAGDAEGRRLGVAPDGMLIPTDRLQAALGSTWHGVDLEKEGLPIAFVHKFDAHTWSLGRGRALQNDEELDRHASVPLTGKFRTVDGVRYEEARDGFWLRADDLVVIVRRTKLPEFATGTQKWLDVSVANQTLTAYEGSKPVYATLISSGRDQLRDPATSASTVRGTFRVRSKHVTRGIDPRELSDAFDVADAPWVMEFEPGYAITGMYWSDTIGEAHGFHDVALTPIDARRLWMWSDPAVPDGWHAAYSGEGEGTIVNVRP